MIDALENNYGVVGILNDRLEKLENRFPEALPKIEKAVSSLREAGKVTVSGEARKILEQDGERVCRKMADRLRNECTGFFDRLSAKGRVVIPGVLFLCMAGVTVFPSVATVCFMAANARFVHGTILWKITGYITCAIVSCCPFSCAAD